MTTRLALLAAIAAALTAPSAASAGGWATVGFDPPPDTLAPGEPWQVELTILQHGVTPLEGVRPRVIVSPGDGGVRTAFPARATGRPGIYRATVVFASAGTWRYVVDDGFAAQHSYPVVQVRKDGTRASAEPVAATNVAATTPPSSGSPGGDGDDDGPNYLLAILAAAVAALAAGGGTALLQRRRGGPGPAGG